MGGVCGMYERGGAAYRIFRGKLEGKKPLGRPRHKREDNIKVSIKAVCWGHGLDSSDSK
jgi:hypothetical protein